MTLRELITAVDSDNMVININCDAAILAKKGQRNHILVEKWKIGETPIDINPGLLSKRVTDYAIRFMVGEVPEVEVCLEGIEPNHEDEDDSEKITLKSILHLFGDQDTTVCIIRSEIGRIYCGPIRGFLSSVSGIYNSLVLDCPVEKVYNETDMESKRRTFFIKIGGSK